MLATYFETILHSIGDVVNITLAAFTFKIASCYHLLNTNYGFLLGSFMQRPHCKQGGGHRHTLFTLKSTKVSNLYNLTIKFLKFDYHKLIQFDYQMQLALNLIIRLPPRSLLFVTFFNGPPNWSYNHSLLFLFWSSLLLDLSLLWLLDFFILLSLCLSEECELLESESAPSWKCPLSFLSLCPAFFGLWSESDDGDRLRSECEDTGLLWSSLCLCEVDAFLPLSSSANK